MNDNLIKILVKVGKTSRTRFSNSKTFRAITVNDLQVISNKYEDCNIVIIESIDNAEYESVKNFITEFVNKNENNLVMFYLDNNDEVTTGLADDLDYVIYFNLTDIYRMIKSKYNVNVSTLLEDRKVDTLVDEDIPTWEIGGEIEDSTGNDDNGDKNNGNEDADDVKNQTEEEQIIRVDLTKAELPITSNTVDNENKTENGKVTVEIEDDSENKNVDTSEINNNCQDVEDNNTAEISNTSSEEIEKLLSQLETAKYDYSVILEDMKEANARIADFSKIVHALREEKQAIQDRFNELLVDDKVLEDPISLNEYESLKDALNEKDKQISQLNDTITELRTEIEESKENSKSTEEEVDTLKDIIREFKVRVDGLESELTEAKNLNQSNDEVNKKIKEELNKHKESADKLRQDNAKLSDTITELNEHVNGCIESLKQSEGKLTLEIEHRKESLALMQSTFVKLSEVREEFDCKEKEIEELRNELVSANQNIENIRNQNDVLNNELVLKDSTIKERNDTIEELNNTISECDTRMALSSSYSDGEMSKMRTTIGELETQLSLTKEKLTQKESQYNSLLQQGASNAALAENNRTLEITNKSLLGQVSALSKELTTTKQERVDLQSQVMESSGKIEELKRVISLSNNGSIDTSDLESGDLIRSINYNARGQIIPVFGSGSYGITTMAMTILYRLASAANVVYVDFDLVNPSADAWFSKSPFCADVPGINPKDTKMSGLGIFFEKGMPLFLPYADKIICEIEQTKGGCIDYLSGVYYDVKRSTLQLADYERLFNLLGSRYDYIIVDLGRLGNSDINNRIIKVISDIAFKSVVVTTSDRFEIRNFKMKLNRSSIDIQKVAWLVNMCHGQNLDSSVQKLLKDVAIGTMPEDNTLRNTRERFTRDRLNRNQFEYFTSSVLFKM